MSKYIDLRIFLISLSFGILMVYLYQPTPTVIYVYPTPDNIDKVMFRDKADNCFKFQANEVNCPDDISQVNTIPIQERKK